jgi:hypothetical protein
VPPDSKVQYRETELLRKDLRKGASAEAAEDLGRSDTDKIGLFKVGDGSPQFPARKVARRGEPIVEQRIVAFLIVSSHAEPSRNRL